MRVQDRRLFLKVGVMGTCLSQLAAGTAIHRRGPALSSAGRLRTRPQCLEECNKNLIKANILSFTHCGLGILLSALQPNFISIYVSVTSIVGGG